MATTSEKSLYERMGGYDAIAAATDELLRRLTSDPDIGVYWRGHSTDSMKRDRQLIVDFLCEAIGGPVVYRGRDMRTSHQGLRITQRNWDILVAHTVATLDHFAVQEPEKQEFLDCAASLFDDIVEEA